MSEGQAQPVRQPATPQTPPRLPMRKRVVLIILAAVFVLGGGAVGLWYYLYSLGHVGTDDAFIAGHIVQVSSRVPGRVLKIRFTDNQRVKQGDLLVEIDPRDFEVRLAQARAALESAENQHRTAETNVTLTRTVATAAVAEAAAGVKESEAGLAMAKANLDISRATAERVKATASAADADAVRAASDLKRYEQLFAEKRISPQQMDAASASAKAAAAQLQAAHKAHDAALAGVAVSEAQVTQAEGKLAEYQAKLDGANAAPQRIAVAESQFKTSASEVARLKALVEQAELELSYTKILATENGYMARKTVEEGHFVQPGQAMAGLVRENVWVVANFKETDVGRLRPGQPVTIRVDAYSDKVFRGRVDSIQAGSGTVFSLLPPENATGNYVKVVQRVPVKIVFDPPPDPACWLAPGMSVVPEVEVTSEAEAK